MQIPLQITTRDFPQSEAVEGHIRDKVAKLEELHQRIMSCRVAVEMPHRHKHQGKLFNVRIDITVPHGEITVNRHADEDLYVAIRDAFDAARRRLEDHARRQRGETKTHAQAFHGRVVRLDGEAGYGFIETEDGRELYFSSENLAAADFNDLEPGTEVQFIEDTGAEGLQAKRISVGKHRVPS